MGFIKLYGFIKLDWFIHPAHFYLPIEFFLSNSGFNRQNAIFHSIFIKMGEATGLFIKYHFFEKLFFEKFKI